MSLLQILSIVFLFFGTIYYYRKVISVGDADSIQLPRPAVSFNESDLIGDWLLPVSPRTSAVRIRKGKNGGFLVSTLFCPLGEIFFDAEKETYVLRVTNPRAFEERGMPATPDGNHTRLYNNVFSTRVFQGYCLSRELLQESIPVSRPHAMFTLNTLTESLSANYTVPKTGEIGELNIEQSTRNGLKWRMLGVSFDTWVKKPRGIDFKDYQEMIIDSVRSETRLPSALLELVAQYDGYNGLLRSVVERHPQYSLLEGVWNFRNRFVVVRGGRVYQLTHNIILPTLIGFLVDVGEEDLSVATGILIKNGDDITGTICTRSLNSLSFFNHLRCEKGLDFKEPGVYEVEFISECGTIHKNEYFVRNRNGQLKFFRPGHDGGSVLMEIGDLIVIMDGKLRLGSVENPDDINKLRIFTYAPFTRIPKSEDVDQILQYVDLVRSKFEENEQIQTRAPARNSTQTNSVQHVEELASEERKTKKMNKKPKTSGRHEQGRHEQGRHEQGRKSRRKSRRNLRQRLTKTENSDEKETEQ